jgi:large subunit ribosomal protein L24
MAARVRKDDIVEVVAGDHKGARGKVLRIIRDKQRVVVEGVNMIYRHVRRSRKHPQGGRIQREAAIHLSNVLPVNPRTNRGTRVRFQIERDAGGHVISKKRIALDGAEISEVTRAGASTETRRT